MKIKKFKNVMDNMPIEGELAEISKKVTLDQFKQDNKLTPELIASIFITGFQSGFVSGTDREIETSDRIIDKIIEEYESIISAPITSLAERVEAHDDTLVFYWADDTVTPVRCSKGDSYDPRVGFCVAYAKHVLGDTGNAMKKHIDSIPGMDEALTLKEKKNKSKSASQKAKTKASDLKS